MFDEDAGFAVWRGSRVRVLAQEHVATLPLADGVEENDEVLLTLENAVLLQVASAADRMQIFSAPRPNDGVSATLRDNRERLQNLRSLYRHIQRQFPVTFVRTFVRAFRSDDQQRPSQRDRY